MAMSPLASNVITGVVGRARTVLSSFTTGQKIMTALAVVAVAVGGSMFMRVESQPNYQPLFTGLQPADAGAVTAQLTTAKVPFELSNGGATILVPANVVDQERVTLAEQGLPSSGAVGFSNLEKSGITTSQFVQQVEYQQALEGQLQQTIESIRGVQSAQVNLVIPAQSSFVVSNQPSTTASILVALAPGTTLSSQQVQAIVHLTASATPGLSPSNVTVADNRGDMLSSNGVTTAGTGTSDEQQTNSYDTQLATAIESLLGRVVGPGNSAVQVHAQLNFNQQSTTLQGLQTNAQGQPITAATGQTTSSASYTGSGTPPSGVLGSGTPSITTGSGVGKYTSTSSQVTNAVGQITQTVKQAPGQVVKTSVAVLLNSSAIPKASRSQVSALVSAAAGLSKANGDQLVVTAMPFAKSAVQPALTTGSAWPIGRLIEMAVLALIIAALVFFALRAARRTSYDEMAVPTFSVTTPESLAADPHPLQSIEVTTTPLHGLERPPDIVLSQVGTYIEQRPAEVARLLRAWASENDGEWQ